MTEKIFEVLLQNTVEKIERVGTAFGFLCYLTHKLTGYGRNDKNLENLKTFLEFGEDGMENRLKILVCELFSIRPNNDLVRKYFEKLEKYPFNQQQRKSMKTEVEDIKLIFRIGYGNEIKDTALREILSRVEEIIEV